MRGDMGRMRVAPTHATALHGVAAPAVETATADDEVQAALPVEPQTAAKQAKPESSTGRRVAWTVSMVGIGVVVGLIIVGYLKFIDGPVSGSVKDTSLDQARAAAAQKPMAPNMLGGLAFDLQYPAIFDTVGQVKTDTHSTEQYLIGSKADYGRGIAVAVRPLEANSLSNDSSYQFRMIKTTDYTPKPEKIGADAVVVMVKTDGHEQTLFWPHLGQEITVSITSTNPHDDLPAFMALIKRTLRWHK